MKELTKQELIEQIITVNPVGFGEGLYGLVEWRGAQVVWNVLALHDAKKDRLVEIYNILCADQGDPSVEEKISTEQENIALEEEKVDWEVLALRQERVSKDWREKYMVKKECADYLEAVVEDSKSRYAEVITKLEGVEKELTRLRQYTTRIPYKKWLVLMKNDRNRLKKFLLFVNSQYEYDRSTYANHMRKKIKKCLKILN